MPDDVDAACAPAASDQLHDGDQGHAAGQVAPDVLEPLAQETAEENEGQTAALTTTAAVRSYLVPLNGRASGPPSGRTLGRGRKAYLAPAAGLADSSTSTPAGTLRPSKCMQTPGTALAPGAAETGATTGQVKGFKGSQSGLQGPGSGGIRLQVHSGGIMGSGTPTYRVSGLRRSSGPRLHASIGRTQ